MPVYLARFGASGPVKIGHSQSVQKRLDGLQARMWDNLYLLRMLDGTAVDERALHKRFARLRIRFEWFHYSVEMEGDLGLPDITRDPTRALARLSTWCQSDPEKVTRSNALREWMVRDGLLEHDLAKLLGCAPSTVAGWIEHRGRPERTFGVKLLELSNGAVADFWTGPVKVAA